MLIEFSERKVDKKLRAMKVPKNRKQTIIEYGLAQIEKELGV